MPNNYYNFGTTFSPGSKVRSDQVNTQYQALETAFDLLPANVTSLAQGTTTFCGTSAGAGNAYTVSPPNARASDAAGDEVVFISDKNNTGAVTLDVDGNGARALVAPDGSALLANDIQTGLIYVARYDLTNTRWQLINPSSSYLFNAAASAAAAAASELAAGLSETAAGLSETAAALSETNAAASEVVAQQWAVNPEDDDVDSAPGEFSALHWAAKAAVAVGLPSSGTLGSTLYHDGGSWIENTEVQYDSVGLAQLSVQAPALEDGSFALFENAIERMRLEYDQSADLVRLRAAGAATEFLIEEGVGTNIAARFDPSGGQILNFGSNPVLTTQAGGILIQDDSGDVTDIEFHGSGGLELGRLVATSTSFSFGALQSSATVSITANDTGGTPRFAFLGNPNGATSLYYTGLLAFATDIEGASVYDTAGTESTLKFFQFNQSTRNGFLQMGATTTILRAESHSATLALQGENSAGTVTPLFLGDPNGISSMYHTGTVRISTAADGVDVFGTFLDLNNGGAATSTWYRQWNSAGGVGFNTATNGNSSVGRLNGTGGSTGTYIGLDLAGAVSLYYNGVNTFETTSTGIATVGTASTVISTSATAVRYSAVNSLGGIDLRVRATGEGSITQRSASDVAEDLWIDMERNGAVSLFYNNETRLKTSTGGFNLLGATGGGSANLYFQSNAEVQWGRIFNTGTNMGIRNEVSNGDISFEVNDGGVNRTVMVLDGPTAGVVMNHAGTLMFDTQSDGARVHGGVFEVMTSTTGATRINVNNSEGGLSLYADGDAGFIYQTTAAGTTEDVWIGMNNNGAVNLYYNNTAEFRSADSNANYNTAGAEVKDHGGTYRDVGFNTMTVTEQDASITLSEIHVGRMLHKDNTTNITWTLPSGSSGAVPPVGATIMGTRENGTGTLTITASGTLRWFGGTGTPTTGSRTIANGAVFTMFHYSSTEWWIWGNGIS